MIQREIRRGEKKRKHWLINILKYLNIIINKKKMAGKEAESTESDTKRAERRKKRKRKRERREIKIIINKNTVGGL